MKTRTKALLTVACALLLVVATVFGTVAYLTAKTDTVKNTFTVGKVNVDLAETTGTEYEIVPGVNITKDPKVTVKTGSEDSYVFVKVEKTNWPASGVTYTMGDDWTALTGVDDVYYHKYTAEATDVSWNVIKNNTITVSKDLTTADCETIAANPPALSFTAYAIQESGFTTAQDAWAEVNK